MIQATCGKPRWTWLPSPQQPSQSPVHDRGATSGHHGPDPPLGVQQGQLQACPTFGIQVCDVGFLGTRQQQVGPGGTPFTRSQIPGPLPFSWSRMKKSSIAFTVSGRRGCAGPHVPGTKRDAISKHQNPPQPVTTWRQTSQVLSDFKSLALCPSPRPRYVTLLLAWPPLPASACLAHPVLCPPGPIPPPSPASSLDLGSITMPDAVARTSQRMGWEGAIIKFSASGRENYLPGRIRGATQNY